METWAGCQRKWAYSRVRPRASNPYAEFGRRTHAVLESWLRSMTPPDTRTPEGRCAVRGLDLIPHPRDVSAVEHSWKRIVGGIEYVGVIDFVYGYVPGRVIVIGDHKTTGNMAYRKSPKILLTDPQRIVYAYHVAEELQVDQVVAHWVYYQRDGQRAEPSIVVEDRRSIAERFEELHRTRSLPIVNARPTLDAYGPEAFPRDFSHCRAFGGCPFAGECLADVSPIERAASILTQTQTVNGMRKSP